MTDFIIKKLPYDHSSHSGLAFIGKYLKRVKVKALIDPKFPVRSWDANREILKSYLALLCLGKSDFNPIEGFRDSAFFKRALVLGTVPSSPTRRQRMHAHEAYWFELAPQMNHLLLGSRINGQPIDFGALACGYTPVDLDSFAMDNGGTQIELVGRTRQNTLTEPDAPVLHAAKRRRIKKVMQELMFKAARMIRHAGRWVLGLGQSDRGFAVFERHYRQLSGQLSTGQQSGA